MDIKFEHMAVEHGKEIMDIFNYYIENSFAAYPDSRLPYEFYGRLGEMTRNYPAYVIKRADKVVGFCFLHAYNPWPAFKKTAEISYFIKPEEVGKGIGKQALKLLEQEAQKLSINILLANISSKNAASIAFHEKNGFQQCGQFYGIGEKKGQTFDQLWVQKSI